MTNSNEGMQPDMKKEYWVKRSNMMYYRYIDYMVRVLAADAKSLIDIGSADAEYIETFDWIPKRNTLDIVKPYSSGNVEGIEMDLFDYQPKEKFDFATCLQVLEHIPDAGAFASKLFEIADRVLISVPYLWKANSEPEHVHDPVNLEKVCEWTGRKPTYSIVVEEPLFKSHKNKRLICYFHPENEEININKLRQNFASTPMSYVGEVQNIFDKINKQLRKLDAELKVRDKQNQEINSNLKELIRVQKLSNTLRVTEIHLHDYRERLITKKEQNEKLTEKIKKRESKLKDVERKYKKAIIDRNKYEQMYNQIQQRRSWRYLEPARKLMRKIRRV